MKLYVMWCRRCQDYVHETVTWAKSKTVACQNMQDRLKAHDVATHPEDGFPEFDIVIALLPQKGSYKKARGW